MKCNFSSKQFALQSHFCCAVLALGHSVLLVKNNQRRELIVATQLFQQPNTSTVAPMNSIISNTIAALCVFAHLDRFYSSCSQRVQKYHFWTKLKLKAIFLFVFASSMKVPSHPGHGDSRCCIVGNWTCLIFLMTFHLSSKRLLPFRLTGGELAGFLNSVWECPYRVIKDMCELWVSESLRPLVGHWPNWPSCELLALGEPRCTWLLSRLERELSAAL